MSTSAIEFPELISHYEITSDQREAFLRDGHILVRNVLTSDEIAVFAPIIEEVALAHSRETRKLEDRETYGKAFLQITNLWQLDERIAHFVLAKRIGQIAADLMGVEAIRLYHDQALFKEAGGGPTPWHQDQYYWPLSGPCTITMWMPVVDVTADMGIMKFASGSYKLGELERMGISDESQEVFQRYVTERGLALNTYDFVGAGDATFHAGWTLHSAPGNTSDRLRSVQTVIMYVDGVKIAQPQHASQESDLANWFPGQSAGDVAGSALNPVMYSRGA